MKQRMWMTVGLFAITLELFPYPVEKDIEVVMPPELLGDVVYPEASEERAEQHRKRHQAALRASYSSGMYAASSMGRIVKVCDWAGIVKVQWVEVPDGEKKSPLRLELKIECALFGQMETDTVVVYPEWHDFSRCESPGHIYDGGAIFPEWHLFPRKGDRYLVFLAARHGPRPPVEPLNYNERAFTYRKTPATISPTAEWYIIRDDCGVRRLDDDKSEKAYLEAARSYLLILRGEEHDPEKYYKMLRELVLSPINRIRGDARNDLLDFLRFGPSFDLSRVLADTNIDNDIKEYVRLVLIPDGEKKQP